MGKRIRGWKVLKVEATGHIGGQASSVQLDGTRLDRGAYDASGPVSSHWVGAVAEAAEDFAEEGKVVAEALGGDPCVLDCMESWLDDQGVSGREREHGKVLFRLAYESDIAGPVAEGSLRYWDSGELPKGGDHRPMGGYAKLIDALADGLDIRLHNAVDEIRWSTDGVSVVAKSGTFDASHVIVTVPLGVLKAGQIDFVPPVSANHQAAWGRLQMGVLEKVVVVFDDPLPTSVDTIIHLDPSNPGAMPVVRDFSPVSGRSVWVGLSGGGWAATERRSQPDDQLVALALRRLADGLGLDVPQPVASYVSRWADNPWSRGVYSFILVGACPSDFDACAKPIGGRLLFAGEHTDAGWYQTTHGAIRSGLREARWLGVRVVWPPPNQRREGINRA
jgi:predicted NAD/FAD-dependent oxidoreductase